jgi:hypothetical protein
MLLLAEVSLLPLLPAQEPHRPEAGERTLAAAAATSAEALATAIHQHALTPTYTSRQGQIADDEQLPAQQQAPVEHQLLQAALAPSHAGGAANQEKRGEQTSSRNLGGSLLPAAGAAGPVGSQAVTATAAAAAQHKDPHEQHPGPHNHEHNDGSRPAKRQRRSSSSTTSSSAKQKSSDLQEHERHTGDEKQQQQQKGGSYEVQAQEQQEQDQEQNQGADGEDLELEAGVPQLPSLPALLLADNPSAAAGEDAISRRTRSRLPLGPVTFDPTEFDRVLAEFDPDVELLVDDAMYTEFLQVRGICRGLYGA